MAFLTLGLVTQTEIRIFKPASGKGASKSFDDALCDAASVTEFEPHGHAIVGLFGDCTTRAYSIPGLKEINKARLSMLDPTRTPSAAVTHSGTVIGFTGPSELALVSVWGARQPLAPSQDVMINPELITPTRPVISNLQWLSGTQYISPTDLDLLIAPDRPPSKRMMAAAAAEQRAARGGAGGVQAGGAGGSQEGWGDYLTRQLNERTEKLNIMGDSMDNLQNQSQGWADDVGKFVNKQKRNLVMGSIKGKFL
jgi:syntaxin-binding protein 5